MDETHSHPPAPRVSNLPLVMLPVLHLAAGGMTALFWSAPFSHDRDWPITTVIGLALSQALLCSYGAALIRGRLVWRWPVSALLMGLASGFALFCLTGIDPHVPDNVATLLTAAL